MKAISFSAVEILPALLSKTKTQTIRPLQRTEKIIKRGVVHQKGKVIEMEDVEVLRPPRFKVGEPVRLYWKQRGSPKDSWFCRECGNRINIESHRDFIDENKGCDVIKCSICDYYIKFNKIEEVEKYIFHKILREGIITEVFEIEMVRQDKVGYGIKFFGKHYDHKELEILLERDGFNPLNNDMFQYFDKNYDLSTPKRFAVYRWDWLKGKYPSITISAEKGKPLKARAS